MNDNNPETSHYQILRIKYTFKNQILLLKEKQILLKVNSKNVQIQRN